MKTCNSFLYIIFALLKANPLSVTTYGDLIGRLKSPMLKWSTTSLPFIYFLASGFFPPKRQEVLIRKQNETQKKRWSKSNIYKIVAELLRHVSKHEGETGQEKLLFGKPDAFRRITSLPMIALSSLYTSALSLGQSSSQISALKY